jgi:hypothetical protein
MRKVLLMSTIAVCALALQPEAAGAATTGNVKAFCRANVAVDASDEPSTRLLERLRATAPDEIADTADTAVTTFKEKGEAAFEDPSFQAAIAAIDQFLLDQCGYQGVDVTMDDYSFDGIPERIGKGVVAFSLRNQGAELHEFTVGRLKGDATLEDLLALPTNASEKAVGKLIQPVRGGGFAFPGQSDLALITLKNAGKYVALCFIPVGTTPDAADGGSGPPHFHEGMAAEFTVTNASGS